MRDKKIRRRLDISMSLGLLLSLTSGACSRLDIGALNPSSDSLSVCTYNVATSAPRKINASGVVPTTDIGSMITAWSNASHTTVVNATIPIGFYENQTVSFAEPNLLAANIVSGIQIFGVTGTFTALNSNMYRDKATTPISIANESTTSAGTNYSSASTGYRAIPQIASDDDGASGTSVTRVDRTGWAALTCGLAGTIAAWIADCAAEPTIGPNAIWDGGTNGNAGMGVWSLVSRTAAVSGSKGREVWRDERTKLLWSSLVATASNWCKASGSNFIAGNTAAENDSGNFCNNNVYQRIAGLAFSACYEDGSSQFDTTDATSDQQGKAGLNFSSTPSVAWRLPTIYDYRQADVDGLRAVIPDTNSSEWTGTISSGVRTKAYLYDTTTGATALQPRSSAYAVRCIGR